MVARMVLLEMAMSAVPSGEGDVVAVVELEEVGRPWTVEDS